MTEACKGTQFNSIQMTGKIRFPLRNSYFCVLQLVSTILLSKGVFYPWPCPVSEGDLHRGDCRDLRQFLLPLWLCINDLCWLNSGFSLSAQPSAPLIQSFSGKMLHIVSHAFPRQQCDGINTIQWFHKADLQRGKTYRWSKYLEQNKIN